MSYQYPSVDDVRADRERWRLAHEKLAVEFEKLQYTAAEWHNNWKDAERELAELRARLDAKP